MHSPQLSVVVSGWQCFSAYWLLMLLSSTRMYFHLCTVLDQPIFVCSSFYLTYEGVRSPTMADTRDVADFARRFLTFDPGTTSVWWCNHLAPSYISRSITLGSSAPSISFNTSVCTYLTYKGSCSSTVDPKNLKYGMMITWINTIAKKKNVAIATSLDEIVFFSPNYTKGLYGNANMPFKSAVSMQPQICATVIYTTHCQASW